MISEFRLVGLSKTKSMTCEPFGKEETFHPNLDALPQDRFDALWDLCTGNWHTGITVLIDHDGLNGLMPINPKFVRVNSI